MKKRIGNDIHFVWHIYRKSGETQTPESFDGKDVEVKLISPLQRTVTIEDVSIATGVVTFTFRGKHQVTLGNYVAILQENRGEDGMVTLDVVNAVTLVPHSYMEEDGDEGDVIEASSVELESEIGQGIDADTKAETDALLEGKYDKVDGIRFLAERRITVTDENGQAATTVSPNEVQFEELNGTQSAEIWLNGGYLRLNDKYRTSPTGNKIATDLELAGLVNTGSYNTVSKKIELKHDNTVLAEIDATAFIKDGMVSSVTINNGYLVITFNTDAGKEPISIALTDIFNPANYYTKAQTDNLLGNKVDKEQGKGLSSNDYTTEEKTKLGDLPTNQQLQLSLEGKANKIPMPPVIHELVISGTTQVSDVITLITGYFYPRTYTQIDSNYRNPAVIEFTVNYTGELRFTGRQKNGGILEYVKAYVNGTLVETSTERITSATLNFDVEANDVVKVEFTRYVTGNFEGCVGNLSITSAGASKDLVDVYSSLASVATSGSYNDLSDKPDLSGFITKSVDDLTNYYLKSETYTKTEVQQLISAIQQFHYEVYPTLPQTGASNVLYLIGPTGTGSDKYEEYVYANNDWTKIGDTSIDLSGYVTTEALTTALADYVTSSALSTALAGKEDKMPIIQVASGTTAINAAVNTYYEVAGEVGALAITLPTPTDLTKVSMIVVHLTAGTTPKVVIGAVDNPRPDFAAAYDISAGKEYEINCMYNGDKWIVADMEVV